MPLIKVRVPRTSQPQEACGVAEGVGFYSVGLPEKDKLRSVVGPDWGYNATASLSAGVSRFGKALVNTSYGHLNRVNPVTNGWISIGFIFAPASVSGTEGIWSIADTNTSGTPYVIIQRNGADLRVYNAGGFTLTLLGVFAVGVPVTVAFKALIATSGSYTYTLGINGKTYSVATTGYPVSSANEFLLSGYANPSVGALGGYWRANTALADSLIKDLSANIWQIFESEEINFWVATYAAGVVELLAEGGAQATASASLLKGVSLAGAALSVATGTADAAHSVPLSAVATGQASSSGQISLTVTFAANAVAQALATAQAALGKPLAASGAGQAAGGADLSVSAGGSAVNLAASGAGQATGTATISLAVSLSAAAVAQATSSAGFAGSAALAAAAIANAQASAALSVGKPLAASAAGQAASSATLAISVQLGAAALAQAASGGSLKLVVNLAAAALGQASSSAALPSSVVVSANGVALATAGASLQVTTHSAQVAGALASGRPLDIQSAARPLQAASMRPARYQSGRPGRYR